MKFHPDNLDGTAWAEQGRLAAQEDRIQVEQAENEGMPEPAVNVCAPRRSRLRSIDTTSLERRVLALERILQSLIAHTSESEPRFVDRLEETFSDSVRMARREHDCTDADDYAEEFIRAVLVLGDHPLRAEVETSASPASRSPAPVAPASDWTSDHSRESAANLELA